MNQEQTQKGEHIEAYPLTWPLGRKRTPPAIRKRATFNSGGASLSIQQGKRRVMIVVSAFTRTGQTWVIDPKTVVVSTNVPVKLSGEFRAGSRDVDDPGVAVYFRLRGRPHCVTCDRWDRVADNLAAIAKHLEAIRGIERWGTADVESLFAGFKALPPSAAVTAAGLGTAEAAADFLVRFGGGVTAQQILSDVGTYQRVWRAGAIQLHPDRNGGQTPAEWHKLTEAKQLLDRRHKL